MRALISASIGIIFSAAMFAAMPVQAAKPASPIANKVGTYKVVIDRSVSMDDATESMRLRANALNLKLVAELPLSKQVEAVTGKPQRTITIFQFCDAVTAKDLIDLNPDFSVYMPCRIALIEAPDGQGWLVMMDVNVEAIAKSKNLAPALKARVNAVRNSLIEIMQAGATGAL